MKASEKYSCIVIGLICIIASLKLSSMTDYEGLKFTIHLLFIPLGIASILTPLIKIR